VSAAGVHQAGGAAKGAQGRCHFAADVRLVRDGDLGRETFAGRCGVAFGERAAFGLDPDQVAAARRWTDMAGGELPELAGQTLYSLAPTDVAAPRLSVPS
jgi:hypothetical protein